MSQQARAGSSRHARHKGPESVQPLTSAYNFVPPADWVFFPSWQRHVSQDRPFKDGLSGSIELELEAHTPLLVAAGKGQGNLRRFITGPDGKPLIPGTSVRGMIRNVLEIASFGKFQRLDNKAMSSRDLQLKEYTSRFTRPAGREQDRPVYENRAQSGWLVFRDGQYRILICGHVRVEYSDLARLCDRRLRWAEAKDTDRRGQPKYKRITAEQKYREYKKLGHSLDVYLAGADEEPKPHRHSCGYLTYAKARDLSFAPLEGRDQQRMTLVFTGHPGSSKHMDFAFVPFDDLDPDYLYEVPPSVIRTFMQVHEDSEIWTKHWQPRLAKGKPVPVFFLLDELEEFAAIGLSQMFRLPFRHSLHEAVANSSGDHLDDSRMDLAECLFGRVQDDKQADSAASLRGRVSFDHATADPATIQPGEVLTVILSNPKPSFYPAYVQQHGDSQKSGRLQANAFTTLSSDEVQLRGWKRYPVRPEAKIPELTSQQQDAVKVQSRLEPLKAGARFRTTLRFHNLRPAELGALLWAIDFGGNERLRHALGMGKPFGLGQVSLKPGAADIRANQGAAPDLEACRAAFVELMEAACAAQSGNSRWLNSPQLCELLAMADPTRVGRIDLRAPLLDGRHNEFAQAKGARRHPRQVLQDYTAMKR